MIATRTNELVATIISAKTASIYKRVLIKLFCCKYCLKNTHSLNYISIFSDEEFQRKRKPLMKGILGLKGT